MEEKHFFAVHTFISDEVRSQFVTPPEKRNPPEKRETEKEWVEKLGQIHAIDDYLAAKQKSMFCSFKYVVGRATEENATHPGAEP